MVVAHDPLRSWSEAGDTNPETADTAKVLASLVTRQTEVSMSLTRRLTFLAT